MSEEYYQLNIGKYFKAIYRQKWLVVLCLCSSIAIALVIVKTRPPIYQAHVSFWIRGIEQEKGVLFQRMMRLFFVGQKRPFQMDFDTQVEIVKSSLILQNAVEKLGLPSKTKELLRDSVKLLKSSIIVSKIDDASIIKVKAIHPSPEMAVNMANAVCQAYIDFNRKLFLEEEERRLESMKDQARLVKEEIGKSDDLVTEKIKGDMYLLLIEKIAETRLNLSLDQSEAVQIIEKADVAHLVSRQGLIIFLTGIMGLFLGIVLAIAIDTFKHRKSV